MRILVILSSALLFLSFQCGEKHEYRDTVIQGQFIDETGEALANFEFYFTYRDLMNDEFIEIQDHEFIKTTDSLGKFKICPNDLVFERNGLKPVLVFVDTNWRHVNNLDNYTYFVRPFALIPDGSPNWNRINMGQIKLQLN